MSTTKDINTPSTSNTTVVNASALPHFEKLDGQNNYNTWKFFMELYLIHEDLWDSVTSHEDEATENPENKKGSTCPSEDLFNDSTTLLNPRKEC